MDPITAALLIKGLIALIAISVIVAILTYEEITNWFVERSELKESDQNNLAFTLQEKLENGHYKTVQGIFNPRTNKILDGRGIESKSIDTKLAAVHAIEALAIYS